MRSIKIMNVARVGYIIMSLLSCVLGVMLLLMPEAMLPVLTGALGVLMILFGAVKLVGYFSKDLYRLAFQYDLALGSLLIVLGIITILKADALMIFLCIMSGIYILADGLLKVQIALDSRRFGIPRWWLILIAAILTGLAGGILIFRPCESARLLVMLLGAGLLAEGILNLITVLTVVKIIRHQLPDGIDMLEYHMG